MAGSNYYDRSIGPELVKAGKNIFDFAGDSVSFLQEAFMNADPDAQKWIQGGAGFLAAMIAVNQLSKVPGLGFLGNQICKIVIGTAAAVVVSGLRFGDAQAAPVPPSLSDQPGSAVTETAAPRPPSLMPGMGGPG